MPFIFLALFIGVPILEIAGFIQIGGMIGLWPTIGLVLLTAFLGVGLLRVQGLTTLFSAQAAIDRGEMPLQQVFDGACLLVAGAFLLTPGFFTDAAGFLLLTPPFRRFMKARLGGLFQVQTPSRQPDPHGGKFQENGGGEIIDVDYQDVTEDDKPSDKDK